MDISVDSGSMVGLSITLIFGSVAVFTLQEWALLCTILAALSTFAYNMARIIRDTKNSKKKQNDNETQANV